MRTELAVLSAFLVICSSLLLVDLILLQHRNDGFTMSNFGRFHPPGEDLPTFYFESQTEKIRVGPA